MNALELLTLGILRILDKSSRDLNDPSDPRHREWWAGLDEGFYEQVRSGMAFMGRPLHQAGFWNALSRVLSHEAVCKIIHYGTFYHVIHDNPGAAEWIIFWLKGLHPLEELVCISQGCEALVTELVKRLSSDGPDHEPLFKGHRLSSLLPDSRGRVRLHMEPLSGAGIEVSARHAILSLPRSPLLRLSPLFPEHITSLVDSVIPVPLRRITSTSAERSTRISGVHRGRPALRPQGGRRHRRWERSSLGRKGLGKIFDEILLIFEPDGEADRAVGDPPALTLFPGDCPVGHGRRVAGQ